MAAGLDRLGTLLTGENVNQSVFANKSLVLASVLKILEGGLLSGSVGESARILDGRSISIWNIRGRGRGRNWACRNLETRIRVAMMKVLQSNCPIFLSQVPEGADPIETFFTNEELLKTIIETAVRDGNYIEARNMLSFCKTELVRPFLEKLFPANRINFVNPENHQLAINIGLSFPSENGRQDYFSRLIRSLIGQNLIDEARGFVKHMLDGDMKQDIIKILRLLPLIERSRIGECLNIISSLSDMKIKTHAIYELIDRFVDNVNISDALKRLRLNRLELELFNVNDEALKQFLLFIIAQSYLGVGTVEALQRAELISTLLEDEAFKQSLLNILVQSYCRVGTVEALQRAELISTLLENVEQKDSSLSVISQSYRTHNNLPEATRIALMMSDSHGLGYLWKETCLRGVFNAYIAQNDLESAESMVALFQDRRVWQIYENRLERARANLI